MMYTLGPCVCLCVQHGPHTQTQLTHVHTYTFAHIPARRTKTHPCKHLSEILQSKPRLFANTSSSVSTSICLYCLPILSISLSRSLALSLSRALPRTLSPSLSHWPYVLVVNTVLLALKQTATRCNKLQRTATHLRSGSSSKSLEQLAFVKRGPNRHSFASFIRHPRHRSTLIRAREKVGGGHHTALSLCGGSGNAPCFQVVQITLFYIYAGRSTRVCVRVDECVCV